MMFQTLAKSTRDILGVYFLCDPDCKHADVFQVLTTEPMWRSLLSQYIVNSVSVRSKKRTVKAEMLTFTFRSFYAALLSYPPFANAVLDTTKYTTSHTQNVYLEYPMLSRYLHPISISIEYLP